MYLHIVLIGLSPLIPVPVLDDWVKAFFQRQLVSDLARVHGLNLTPSEVEILADDHSGCVGGCLTMLVLYPAKKLLRKAFFVLEWQRALNTLSHTYYHAHLLNAVFERGWQAPGQVRYAWHVRRAVDEARRAANTRVLNQLSSETLTHSRDLALGIARAMQNQVTASATQFNVSFQAGMFTGLRRISPRLARAMRQRFPSWVQRRARQEESARARLDSATPASWPGLLDLVQRLQTQWGRIPESHLRELEQRLANALARWSG